MPSQNLNVVQSIDKNLDALCDHLSSQASRWETTDDWPADSLRACADAGVYRWFLPREHGGTDWSPADRTRGYLRLAQADLVTTFIITQYMGAIRRIVGSNNAGLIDRWIEPLLSGNQFGTVGISHLTTSGRHLSKPVLTAKPIDGGFELDGMAPWVTGAPHGDVYVIGATLEDGTEILAAVPRDLAGIKPATGISLVALSASCTDRVCFDGVAIDKSMLIAGPSSGIMSSGTGASPGGLQTSTLAVGLSRAAIGYLADEASRREDLQGPSSELSREVTELETLLLRAAGGDQDCDTADIRGQANRLAMRSTQAALTAAKGAGFVAGHDVGRWCCQALFFLVWSCPQPIANAHLCELAGIA